MTPGSKSASTTATAPPPAGPANWEERATSRVLEARRDQILERSRQIVAAAYELLEDEGLDGLTIRAVLKKTGLSRRAFYERFADKDELVLAVFEETLRLATRYFGEQIGGLSDPIERLKLIVTSLVLGKSAITGDDSELPSRRGAAMSREHLRLAESRPDDLQRALSPLMTLIAQQLARGMEVGTVRKCVPERLAALVYNIVSTTIHTELLAKQTARVDRAHRLQLANDIWDFCRRAIAS